MFSITSPIQYTPNHDSVARAANERFGAVALGGRGSNGARCSSNGSAGAARPARAVSATRGEAGAEAARPSRDARARGAHTSLRATRAGHAFCAGAPRRASCGCVVRALEATRTRVPRACGAARAPVVRRLERRGAIAPRGVRAARSDRVASAPRCAAAFLMSAACCCICITDVVARDPTYRDAYRAAGYAVHHTFLAHTACIVVSVVAEDTTTTATTTCSNNYIADVAPPALIHSISNNDNITDCSNTPAADPLPSDPPARLPLG